MQRKGVFYRGGGTLISETSSSDPTDAPEPIPKMISLYLPRLHIYKVLPDEQEIDRHVPLRGLVVGFEGSPHDALSFFLPVIHPQNFTQIIGMTGVTPFRFRLCPHGGKCRQAIIFIFEHYMERHIQYNHIYQLDRYVNYLRYTDAYSASPYYRASITSVVSWMDILTWNYFEKLFDYSRLHVYYGTIEIFLKLSKNFLYSVWKPGEVPLNFISHYQLMSEQYLLPLDFKKVGVETEAAIIEPC